jgi:hypothetical protein
MFYINDAGQEVHSELTHDWEALAEAMDEQGRDWSDIAETLIDRFGAETKELWDRAEDVGAVMQYFKGDRMVAYFDYENFWGTVLAE